MKQYLINGTEILAAIRNWNQMMNPDPRHMRNSFNTFIGDHELVSLHHHGFNASSSWGWKVPELAYNKIKMLASPHHYALLKAFKAKTGWQGKIP